MHFAARFPSDIPVCTVENLVRGTAHNPVRDTVHNPVRDTVHFSFIDVQSNDPSLRAQTHGYCAVSGESLDTEAFSGPLHAHLKRRFGRFRSARDSVAFKETCDMEY